MPTEPLRHREHLRTGAPVPSHALATRLMRVIFGCYVVVAVCLTGVQVAIEYRRASDRLKDSVATLQQTFSPGLEDALWRFNAEVLGGILTGMTQSPVVLGVEVRDETGKRVRALGTLTDPGGASVRVDAEGRETPVVLGFHRPFSRTVDLVHTERNGQRYPVGSWTLHSDDAIAIDQVKDSLIVIAVNALLKSLLLGLIFFFVIRHMVGQPLTQIDRFLARLDADTLGGAPLTLRAGGHHELHALTVSLNTMVRRLRAAFEDNGQLTRELRAVNASLQERVAERTRELERLAHTDLLTGLDNRRALDTALEAASLRAEAAPLCVILADLDHFKAVNDRHGHKVGDAVLAALAASLREGLHAGRRREDTLGRWGGEEFMIVCPGTPLAEAAALAEDLRQRIATTILPAIGPRTCSFGVAERRPNETTDSLVARADAALYRCKHNGRNHVATQATPEPEPRARGAA